MRLLHMADAHYGRRFTSSRFGPEIAKKRRAALERALQMAVDYANESAVDAVLCAGDLIESAEVRPPDLRALADILSGLRRAKFYAIAGNHDPLDASSPLRRLEGTRNFVLLPPGYSRTMLDESTALHAYSFPEAVVRENPLEGLRLDMGAACNLLLLHCDAVGAASEYLPVRPEFLGRFDYCALGHVHQPLALSPRARYSGSLMGMDLSETGPRGFLVVDLDGDVSAQFVALPIPAYESLEVELAADLGEAAALARIREGLHAFPEDSLCSVTLTGAHEVGGRPVPERLAERLREEGRAVYLIDRTRPAYDLAALFAEHRDDLIGQVIASFGPEDGMSEADALALEYALSALMEGGRPA